MRRSLKVAALAATQLASVLALAPSAHASGAVCEIGYRRDSPNTSSVNYETGAGYGSCSSAISRIDVRLTYVYCPTSTSCNSTGSNFGGSGLNTGYAEAPGGVYNLRGYYKVIVRTTFAFYSGQSFDYYYGNANLPYGSCGLSGTNTWSCAYESAVFARGV